MEFNLSLSAPTHVCRPFIRPYHALPTRSIDTYLHNTYYIDFHYNTFFNLNEGKKKQSQKNPFLLIAQTVYGYFLLSAANN